MIVIATARVMLTTMIDLAADTMVVEAATTWTATFRHNIETNGHGSGHTNTSFVEILKYKIPAPVLLQINQCKKRWCFIKKFSSFYAKCA